VFSSSPKESFFPFLLHTCYQPTHSDSQWVCLPTPPPRLSVVQLRLSTANGCACQSSPPFVRRSAKAVDIGLGKHNFWNRHLCHHIFFINLFACEGIGEETSFSCHCSCCVVL
jgi:hypothetical protein